MQIEKRLPHFQMFFVSRNVPTNGSCQTYVYPLDNSQKSTRTKLNHLHLHTCLLFMVIHKADGHIFAQ